MLGDSIKPFRKTFITLSRFWLWRGWGEWKPLKKENFWRNFFFKCMMLQVFHPAWYCLFRQVRFFYLTGKICQVWLKLLNDDPLIITLFAIQQFWKKIGQTSKNCFFGAPLAQKGVILGHTQNKKHFFFRNNKNRS